MSYYTYEEVKEQLEQREKMGNTISKEVFDVFGFKCIENFCYTEKGWVASFEDCCEFCVHYIVKEYGSMNDKIKFNMNSTLKGEQYVIPLNKKEIAEDKKRQRKRKKPRSKKRFKINNKIGKMSNQQLKKELKNLKDNGISIIRKGKKNINHDVFRYIDLESKNFHAVVYVKGLKPMVAYPCISSNESVKDYVNSEIKRQNKMYKLDIALLK